MLLKIDVALIDAVGLPATGGGTWKATVLNNGAQVQDTGDVVYSDAKLSVTLNVGGLWTDLKIIVTADSYACACVQLNPSSNGNYRDDPLTTVKVLKQDAVSIDLILLRIREAKGDESLSVPRPGMTLQGPWLQSRSSQPTPIYRELLVTSWLGQRNTTALIDYRAATGPLLSADNDGWDRFNYSSRVTNPSMQGAAMLLEYGEVGTRSANGPQFLVGLWAPTRASAASTPVWRDVIAFIHPSTAKRWYPQVAYPFRAPYPYVVRDAVQDQYPFMKPSDPDRVWQPYVNLALHYLVGDLAPYQWPNNEAIMISPVFPKPPAAKSEQLAYGLPFRTTAGLARLIVEVNLFLHRSRYGFPGSNFDHWWGARSIAAHFSTFQEVKAPPLRRVAVAAYSTAAKELNSLLSTEPLSTGGRYGMNLWGVPDTVLEKFSKSWIETWCLDLFAQKNTTVPAPIFEDHLKKWVDDKSERRFIMGGSGTTGHNNPDAHYPKLSKASASNTPIQSSTVANRHARLWRGPSDKWLAVFCTNAYLSANTADTSHWPQFPMSPTSDEAHGFMFQLTSGLALGWTQVGVP